MRFESCIEFSVVLNPKFLPNFGKSSKEKEKRYVHSAFRIFFSNLCASNKFRTKGLLFVNKFCRSNKDSLSFYNIVRTLRVRLTLGLVLQ